MFLTYIPGSLSIRCRLESHSNFFLPCKFALLFVTDKCLSVYVRSTRIRTNYSSAPFSISSLRLFSLFSFFMGLRREGKEPILVTRVRCLPQTGSLRRNISFQIGLLSSRTCIAESDHTFFYSRRSSFLISSLIFMKHSKTRVREECVQRRLHTSRTYLGCRTKYGTVRARIHTGYVHRSHARAILHKYLYTVLYVQVQVQVLCVCEIQACRHRHLSSLLLSVDLSSIVKWPEHLCLAHPLYTFLALCLFDTILHFLIHT